jgi:prefoldin subunit 5
MTQEERRLEKLEAAYVKLEDNISELNTTIALLNQSLDNILLKEEKRQQMRDRSVLFVVGGFISAFVAWVVRGGLGQ